MNTRPPYPSDLTDVPWDNIEHLFPPEHQPPGQPGRHRTYPRQEVVNAICYLARSGCAWRMLPQDFPPLEARLVLLLHVAGPGPLAARPRHPPRGCPPPARP